MVKNKKNILILLILACLAAAGLVYIYKDCFRKTYPESTIVIQAAAVKNSDSYGTDVRIESVKINGTAVDLSEAKLQGGWFWEGQVLTVLNPSSPAQLTLQAEDAKKLEIEFCKQEGSGIAKIFENQKEIGSLDLYSADPQETVFQKQLGEISWGRIAAAYVLLDLFVFIGLVLFMRILEESKDDRKLKIYLSGLGVLMALLLAADLGFGAGKRELIRIYLPILICGLITALMKKLPLNRNWQKSLCMGGYMLGSAAAAYILTQQVSGSGISIGGEYIAGNIVIYGMLLFVLLFITARLWISAAAVVLAAVIFSIANYYVTSFRGCPILPGDFWSAGTAAEVFSNYHYNITWGIVSAVLVAAAWCWMAGYASLCLGKVKRIALAVWLVPAAVAAGAVTGSDFFKPQLDLWNLSTNVQEYGVAMSMVANIRRMEAEKPEGYSLEELDELSLQYEDASTEEASFTPNLVVVMNESFSDLSVVDPSLDSSTYLSYFNSLEENVIKGYAYVSTLGGGTANTEYEFLTGNTMAFIPGMVPYQQLINQDVFSSVGFLKELGYSATALHPYDKSGYRRYKVYPWMGFDQFIDMEAFEDPELERNLYITDEESYKKLIQIYEQQKEENSDQPVFIFNVTMQNHSGYTSGYFEDKEEKVEVPQYEGRYPELEEYLSLIKRSDEAIHVLLDYFQQVEEPTAILFFGDHQPNITSSYYEEVFGKPASEWSFEEAESRYIVPFFIWANFDIEAQTDVVTSANYLSSLFFQSIGIPKDPYQNFLLELSQKIPVVTMNGYLGDDGNWHGTWEENGYKSLMNTYWKIEYNNIYARTKSAGWWSAGTG